jgi:hypothetical protein
VEASDEKNGLSSSRLHALNHLYNVSPARAVTLSIPFLVGRQRPARNGQDTHSNNSGQRDFSAFHDDSSSAVMVTFCEGIYQSPCQAEK